MEKSIMVPASHAGRNASAKKKLMPYHPNATRNRPKHAIYIPKSIGSAEPQVRKLLQMQNTAGSRFGIHPSIKTERYRGSSQIRFESPGDPESKRPWKTCNQIFAECTDMQHTVGLANQGISADVAQRMHKRLGIYN